MLDTNAHKNICIEIHELAVKKDRAYGSSFSKGFDKRGMISVLYRLEDKLNRLETLIDNPEIDDVGESIRDTLLDTAGYAILGILKLDESNTDRLPVDLSKLVTNYFEGQINLKEEIKND